MWGWLSRKPKKILPSDIFDDRNKKYPVTDILPVDARVGSSNWYCPIRLNQGLGGKCVGYSVAHELATEPNQVKNVGRKLANKIYKEAKRNDKFLGTWYKGSTIEGGMKACRNLGLYDRYYWSFTLNEMKLGLTHIGPALMSIKWSKSMSTPNQDGFIEPDVSFLVRHVSLCTGYNERTDTFTILNSYSQYWGDHGKCYIKGCYMELLLHKGLVAFPISTLSQSES